MSQVSHERLLAVLLCSRPLLMCVMVFDNCNGGVYGCLPGGLAFVAGFTAFAGSNWAEFMDEALLKDSTGYAGYETTLKSDSPVSFPVQLLLTVPWICRCMFKRVHLVCPWPCDSCCLTIA